MNARGFQITNPSETMDEIARLAPIYGGVTYSKLEAQGSLVLRTQFSSPQPTQVLYASKEDRGLQWPCPEAGHSGTATLYDGGFADKKAEPITPEFRVAEPGSYGQNPVWFVPGRVLLQQDRPMEIVKGKRNRIQREEWVEINPADASDWSLEEGDRVTVETGSHHVPGVVRFNDSVPRGVAASTALFGQLAIDMQASEEFDPASRVPGLEIERARLVKAGAEQASATSA
jgi:predicted molibdopterin-dependent oxidoreductase YjgC